ncbi:CLUMA_CG002181, isoform A [Clunio marinus]|uniref:CLUMA_CG002181, isoform A n=1 Tax=Clunio marinus TaxID=568069 RepID=A0A1J1HLX1_9DIPT|nr:CLUMA_CG002181, isoform A [Clunio marinus]
MKCIVGFLRMNDVHEELLDSVESSPNSTLCDQIINSQLNEMHEKMGLNKVSEENAVKCAKRSIEESGVKKLYLLTTAVGNFEVGWKIWKLSSQQKRYSQLGDTLNKAIKAIESKCNEEMIKENIGAGFDKSIYNRVENYRGDQEYCIRKHLVVRGVLDQFAYNLILNPKGINENLVDCATIVSNIVENSYRKMKFSQCEIDEFRRRNYIEYDLKIEYVLPNLYLTPHEIAKEKRDYIETVYKIRSDAKALCKELLF